MASVSFCGICKKALTRMKLSADADFKIKEYLCALLKVETVEVK